MKRAAKHDDSAALCVSARNLDRIFDRLGPCCKEQGLGGPAYVASLVETLGKLDMAFIRSRSKESVAEPFQLGLYRSNHVRV